MLEKKNVWRGAALLTVVSLLVKILSAIYRIPYQNMVGDVGYYIYQQVYPIFGIGVSVATYGFPVVLSKLVAEKIGEGKEDEIPGIMRVSFFYLSALGVGIFSLLFFGAETIARLMGDVRLASLITTISFSFLLMPAISLLRGYFQGKSRMAPTAISQLVEQTVRVGVILFLALFLLQRGYDMYEVGSRAMLGAVLGGVVGLGTLLVAFFRRENVTLFFQGGKVQNKGRIARVLFVQGIAICITNLIIILIQFVDSFSFVTLLIGSGYEDVVAKAAKGVYDRGFPLIQLGVVAATSISLALLPSMAEANIKGRVEEVKNYIQIVSKYCCIIAFGATVGLIVLARPVNIMLFENATGTNTMQILAGSIALTAVIITSGSILQSLGEVLVPTLFVLLGVIGKVIGNMILIPHFQVPGAAMATVFALFFVMICNIVYLYRKKGYLFMGNGKIGRILLANAIMALVLLIYGQVTSFGDSRTAQTIFALTGVFLGVAVYGWLLVLFGIVTKQEGALLLKGKKASKESKKKVS